MADHNMEKRISEMSDLIYEMVCAYSIEEVQEAYKAYCRRHDGRVYCYRIGKAVIAALTPVIAEPHDGFPTEKK